MRGTTCPRPVDVLPTSVGRCTGRFLLRINEFTLIWEGGRVAESNRVQRSPHLWETGRRDGVDAAGRAPRTLLRTTLPRPVHLSWEFLIQTGFLGDEMFPDSPHREPKVHRSAQPL